MTIYVEPTKATIDGESYFIELGTVKEAWLGKEDHGIYTYSLTFDFGGSGQGAGNYNLNGPTQMGLHLQALMNFFACPFNYIENKSAYVLRDHNNGAIVGLLNEQKSKYLIFREVCNGKD